MEFKVGLFVFIGLALLAVLALLLSRGTGLFSKTIDLKLRSANVGGIKRGASVLMAGVSVGRVSSVELGSEGTNVIMHLKVLAKYNIYEDARFELEQAGFLGDQHVAIHAGKNHGRLLASGDEVVCANPFNLQETVTRAADAVTRINAATTNVDAVVTDVRRLVLNQEKLERLGTAVDHLAYLIFDARAAISNLNTLVVTNSVPLSGVVSNLQEASEALIPLTAHLIGVVTNNEDEIAIAIKNVEIASAGLTNVMHDLQTGRGTAGRLIYDEQMGTNLAAIAQNLSITSSNLNRRGLWGILWKQKEPRTNSSASGKRK
jgi:phospholipid/cholesterol/gamma-HCH transport system substrate-binding protein